MTRVLRTCVRNGSVPTLFFKMFSDPCGAVEGRSNVVRTSRRRNGSGETEHVMRRRLLARAISCAVALMGGVMVIHAEPALAGAGAGTTIVFPTSVTVGQ